MMQDVSRTGMFVATSEPVPFGTWVQLELATADGRRTTHGTVAWLGEGGPGPSGIGIALREPTDIADELFALAVEHLVRRAVAEQPVTILSGELEGIGVPPLLTMLERERKTGRLVLTSDTTIWLDLVRGRIVDARSPSGAGTWATIMTALDLREGWFELRRDEPAGVPGIEIDSITHLLLEHARWRDEATHSFE